MTAPYHSFLQMLFLTANQQCQSTEGNPPYPIYQNYIQNTVGDPFQYVAYFQVQVKI